MALVSFSKWKKLCTANSNSNWYNLHFMVIYVLNFKNLASKICPQKAKVIALNLFLLPTLFENNIKQTSIPVS